MQTPKLSAPGFTSAEVATMLGVKPSTVRSWISRRELRAYKVDNRRYISSQQIAEFHLNRGNSDYVDMTYANGPVGSYRIG
ncbi:SinI-like, DNA-binding domain [Candidatus Nanopelagicaceae bacterium]